MDAPTRWRFGRWIPSPHNETSFGIRKRCLMTLRTRQLVGVSGWQRRGLRYWFWQQDHRNELRHPESVRLAKSVQ
jgi:hypothetical protein